MGDKLIIECTYNTDLFEDEMMQLRMQDDAIENAGVCCAS